MDSEWMNILLILYNRRKNISCSVEKYENIYKKMFFNEKKFLNEADIMIKEYDSKIKIASLKR